MKVIKIIYPLILFSIFSCKTTVANEPECGLFFGIDESNTGSVKIDFIKKELKKEFIYYQYSVERCPGYLSNNCIRFYNLYSDTTPKLREDVKETNNCFILADNQKFILSVLDYKKFIINLPNSVIKDELFIELNKLDNRYIDKSRLIDKHKKNKLFEISMDSVYIYEFEINTEQLNFYIRPSGAIFNYSAYPQQKTKVILIIPVE